MRVPFTIPGNAEMCAKDLAADCRALGKRANAYHEAIKHGEASPQDVADYHLLRQQISGLAAVVCVDLESGDEFLVADYVTQRLALLGKLRAASLAKAYERITKLLH